MISQNSNNYLFIPKNKKYNIHSLNHYEKYVKKIYTYDDINMKDYHFDKGINTIMIKAAMGMGKTKNLHNLFKYYKNKKILIVSFRRTLDKEYSKNFEGFTLYEDIKSNTYDTEIYEKMVVQIDSLHKVRGNIDLLVLDEFTYTELHLVERAKFKESVYNTLLEYIRDLNINIILMDALLDEYTIKWFYHQKRNIQYVENKYKKHTDIKVINYENKIGIFIDDILDNLSKNKKLIIPTNSKSFLNTLDKKIKNSLPNIKYRFLNADNSDDINLENWDQYDIVGYTPTIVAGVSYEEKYFDKIFGYFVNSSSCAEMSLQQLFRVRNLNDKEINICVENKDNNKYLTNIKDIEKYIIDRNTCLVDGVMNIKISRIHRNIIKDSYYYMYRDCQIKIFRSKNNYLITLLDLLKQQGITNIKNIEKIDIENDRNTRKEMSSISKLNNETIIKDIVTSDEIDNEEYGLLKNKFNLTYNDKNKIKKKTFRNTYGYIGNISTDMYKKFSKKYLQFKNLNTLYTLKEDIVKYLEDKIQTTEKNKENKHTQVINEEVNEFGNKIISANPYILHQSKNNEKFIIGLELITVLGANNVFNKDKFKIDFKKLLKYINEKEYIIRLLFKCKEFDTKNININGKENHEIIKYINARLRTLFNIQIKKIDKYKEEYIVDNLDYWTKEINPFKENEDLKQQILLETMLKSIGLDL